MISSVRANVCETQAIPGSLGWTRGESLEKPFKLQVIQALLENWNVSSPEEREKEFLFSGAVARMNQDIPFSLKGLRRLADLGLLTDMERRRVSERVTDLVKEWLSDIRANAHKLKFLQEAGWIVDPEMIRQRELSLDAMLKTAESPTAERSKQERSLDTITRLIQTGWIAPDTLAREHVPQRLVSLISAGEPKYCAPAIFALTALIEKSQLPKDVMQQTGVLHRLIILTAEKEWIVGSASARAMAAMIEAGLTTPEEIRQSGWNIAAILTKASGDKPDPFTAQETLRTLAIVRPLGLFDPADAKNDISDKFLFEQSLSRNGGLDDILTSDILDGRQDLQGKIVVALLMRAGAGDFFYVNGLCRLLEREVVSVPDTISFLKIMGIDFRSLLFDLLDKEPAFLEEVWSSRRMGWQYLYKLHRVGFFPSEEIRSRLTHRHVAYLLELLNDNHYYSKILSYFLKENLLPTQVMRSPDAQRWQEVFLAAADDLVVGPRAGHVLDQYIFALGVSAYVRNAEQRLAIFDFITPGILRARQILKRANSAHDSTFYVALAALIDQGYSPQLIEQTLLYDTLIQQLAGALQKAPWRTKFLDAIGKILREGEEVLQTSVLRPLLLLAESDAANAKYICTHFLEPLILRRHDIFSADALAAIQKTLASVEERKYVEWYDQSLRDDPKATASSIDFPLRSRFQKLMQGPRKRLLVVHNIRDGMGDELIRVGPLLRGLLAWNPAIDITLVTEREFLYDHEAIRRTFPVRTTALAALVGKRYDMIVTFDAANQNYNDALRVGLTQYIGKHPPPVHLAVPDGAGGSARAAWGCRVEDESVMPPFTAWNVYLPSYRMLAELGLPLKRPAGRHHRPGTSPLTQQSDSAADRYWNEYLQPERDKGRKIVLVNGFGGTHERKGFLPTDQGRQAFAEMLRDVLRDPSVSIFILPTENTWGTPDIAEDVIARTWQLIPENERENIKDRLRLLQLPSENPRTLKHVVDRADLILAVEGGIMHLAEAVGNSFLVLPMEASGDFEIWMPPTAGRYHRHDPDEQDVSDSLRRLRGALDEQDHQLRQSA